MNKDKNKKYKLIKEIMYSINEVIEVVEEQEKYILHTGNNIILINVRNQEGTKTYPVYDSRA